MFRATFGKYWAFLFQFIITLDSVTRLGDFWKFLVTTFLTKIYQKIGNFLGYFVKPNSLLKAAAATFWAFLVTLGYFLVQHLVTLSGPTDLTLLKLPLEVHRRATESASKEVGSFKRHFRLKLRPEQVMQSIRSLPEVSVKGIEPETGIALVISGIPGNFSGLWTLNWRRKSSESVTVKRKKIKFKSVPVRVKILERNFYAKLFFKHFDRLPQFSTNQTS